MCTHKSGGYDHVQQLVQQFNVLSNYHMRMMQRWINACTFFVQWLFYTFCISAHERSSNTTVASTFCPSFSSHVTSFHLLAVWKHKAQNEVKSFTGLNNCLKLQFSQHWVAVYTDITCVCECVSWCVCVSVFLLVTERVRLLFYLLYSFAL